MTQAAAADKPRFTIVYRTAMGISVAVAAIALYFFLIGIADGTVSSFNIGIWTLLLGGIAAALWAGRFLRTRGRTGLAIAVLCVTAVPGVLGALFLLFIIVAQPRWN
jgi:hypothetical protein